MQHYRMHGLTIASDLPLHATAAAGNVPPDVTIQIGAVPQQLSGPAASGVFYAIQPQRLLLTIPRIARYLVQDGNTITVQPADDAPTQSVTLFLYGSPLAALLQQRGLLTLHAAAIKTPQGAVLLVGQSSSGKTTLAAACWQRGLPVLADDIVATSAQSLQVVPQMPYLRVWPRTLKAIGQAYTDPDAAQADAIDARFPRVRPELEKRWLSLGDGYCEQALPLHAIYLILPPHRDEATLETLGGLEKVALLKRNTYLRAFLEQTGRDVWHLQQCTRIAQRVRILRLKRPRRRFDLDRVLDRLQADWT